MKRSVHKDLKIIKLTAIFACMILAVAIPLIALQIANPQKRLTLTSNAQVDQNLTNGPTQSWVVSPNGSEIISNNTEVQFFAKDATDANAKFAFTMDLFKGSEFVKNLFIVGIDQEISNRDGIRSKYVDFTGLVEGADYKLRLTTSSANGQITITDYSDNFFTVSTNNAKPIFNSTPITSATIGTAYNYEITISDPTQVTLSASNLPNWLKLNGNKLTGTPTTEGIYSIAILANNSLNRKTYQVFSISVARKGVATPTPTQNPNTGKTDPAPESRVSTVKFPSGGQITSLNSKIESILDTGVQDQLKRFYAEISRDGNTWEKVFESTTTTSFELDSSKYEGGDYYFRFIYEFTDGFKEVKSFGPIKIIKQNTDGKVKDVILKETKPVNGEKITDRKPVISSIFEKPAGTNINLNSFKLLLNDKDLTKDPNTKVSPFSFTYAPTEDLEYGKYTVKLTIGLDNAQPVTQEWSFEIVDKSSKELIVNSSKVLTKNKIILIIIGILLLLILLIALWLIVLGRKEEVYMEKKKTTVIQNQYGDSPLTYPKDRIGF